MNNKNKKNSSQISSNTSDKLSSNDMNSIHKKVIPIYIIFGLIILLSIYMLSPLSKIDTVTVQGNTEVVDEDIIETSTINNEDSVWGTYFNQNEIEQKIVNDLPQVSQADLAFSGVDDFTLNIEEHSTIAFLENNENEYLKVLGNGELVNTESSAVGERPILINFQDDEVLDQLTDQLSELNESVIQLISEIEKMDVERNPLLVRSYMNDGSQVIASIPTYAERISLYPQLVEAVDGQNGLFDLEAGAYFTPFSNEETDNTSQSMGTEESQSQDTETNNQDQLDEGIQE